MEALNASYLDLNWLTETDSMTDAGRAFHSLTTLFVKKLALSAHFVEYCPESLLLCPLIPLTGPEWL